MQLLAVWTTGQWQCQIVYLLLGHTKLRSLHTFLCVGPTAKADVNICAGVLQATN